MRIATLASVAVASAVLGPVALATQAAADDSHGYGLSAIGLAHDQLVAFTTDAPGHAHSVGQVSGLSGDSKLVGIDYRVQDGHLYGVGDKGGIYTLDAHTAKATKVSDLTVDLEGSYFGVDFNPAANRLRVISDTGQNLRHNIDDKAAPRTTISDGTLKNPATPPSTDTPVAMGVTGAAYTNNDVVMGTATTLFDIDTTNDRVSLQSPANAGSLAPTGGLGIKAGPSAGFDIHYDAKQGTNHGFAVLHADNAAGLYGINLLTGKASHTGHFPSHLKVSDLAVKLSNTPSGGMATGGGALAADQINTVGGFQSASIPAGVILLAVLGFAGSKIFSRRRAGTSTD
ncbi:DUF4394 domain-containing protein [Streptomyces sp. NPDC001809]